MKKADLEELIRIAKANKEYIFNKDVSKNLDEATKFSIAFDVKSGKNKVLYDTIYKAYSIWAINPDSKKKFQSAFSNLFEAQKGENKQYYLINYKPAQLVNEAEKRKVYFDK